MSTVVMCGSTSLTTERCGTPVLEFTVSPSLIKCCMCTSIMRRPSEDASVFCQSVMQLIMMP